MLALGIDCGTSKVALALVDASGTQAHTASLPHQAAMPGPPGRAEQDVAAIVGTAERLIRELPGELKDRILGIGLTGQMHGVLLHDALGSPGSPLVTWQDQRTLEDPAFLPSLGSRRLFAGYGLATLAWWAGHGGVGGGLRASTIHGYLAVRWCGLDRAPIDPTDAQAWGGLEAPPGVPAAVLPCPVGHGDIVGTISPSAATDLGLRAGIPVAAPLGDNQASLRATLTDPLHELAFTVGTGCQLTAVVPRGGARVLGLCELRPYDDAHDLVVAATLSGGAAWQWLADTAISWMVDLGLPPLSRDAMFAHLDRLGLAARDRLEIRPHLLGERHDPSLTGTVQGLTLDAGSLGEWARAMTRGIATVARDMLPAPVRAGRTRVVASGNALRRSLLLRTMSEAAFGLPLLLADRHEEAATGAAGVAMAKLRA